MRRLSRLQYSLARAGLGEGEGAEFGLFGNEAYAEHLLSNIPKRASQRVLDLGCGLGGQAHYLQAHGYGQAIGVDIDAESIAYASERYPDVEFYVADATAISQFVAHVDVILANNVFLHVEDKRHLLSALSEVTNLGGLLVVSDFAVDNIDAYAPVSLDTQGISVDGGAPMDHPLSRESADAEFLNSGWTDVEWEEVTPLVVTGYRAQIENVHHRRAQLVRAGGDELFDYMLTRLERTLVDIQERTYYPVILKARRG